MRRTLIVALAVLALSVGVCAADALAVGRTVGRAGALAGQAIEAMRRGDTVAAGRAAQAMLDLWRRHGSLMEMLTAHDTLSEVEGHVLDALICLERGERLEFMRTLSEAGTALERMRTAESVRLLNLF